MSDLNTFFVSGVIKNITIDAKGWCTVSIAVARVTQKGEEEFTICIIYWGDKASKVNNGDYVIASGYVRSKMVNRKDGSGAFPSVSLVGGTIKKITSTQLPNRQTVQQPTQSTMNFDDAPF